MAVDIHNAIQAYKYQKEHHPRAAQQTIQLYQQLCAVYIMNDHDRLFQLLVGDDARPEARGRKQAGGKELAFGMKEYLELD